MYKTSSELRELQLKCVEILDVVNNICEKNNIEYSLCGGSVVGAYLYQGVIPWDDDIDLMMTRENYENFILACKRDLPAKYQLQNYKTGTIYKTLFSKIVDTETTLVQLDKSGEEVVNGVFLDITVYDRIPCNIFRRIDFALANFSQMLFYSDLTKRKTIKKKLLALIGNRCSGLYILFEYIIRGLGNTKHYEYCELFGAFCQNKAYPKEIFESYTKISFEGKEYFVVEDYLQYLVCRYERTDFYEPEERQIPTHYCYVNFKLPYKEYLKKKNEN